MRWEIIKLLLILGVFLSLYQVADAQVIVKTRPVRAGRTVIKTKSPGNSFFWKAGHWKWHNGQKKYVWADGGWIKKRNGFVWMDGHWRSRGNSYLWIPGRWKKG